MADEHQFVPGVGGVAAFDQQHAAALDELRGAKAFLLVVAEPGEGEDDVQTRVVAASRDSMLLGAACCLRSVDYGLKSLQEMQGN